MDEVDEDRVDQLVGSLAILNTLGFLVAYFEALVDDSEALVRLQCILYTVIDTFMPSHHSGGVFYVLATKALQSSLHGVVAARSGLLLRERMTSPDRS